MRLGRRFNRWMYRIRGEVFDQVVADLERRHGAKFDSVVDVGSGTGFYVDRWLRTGARVTGVDLTEVAVGKLREAFPKAEFVQADIGQPLPPALAARAGTVAAVSAFDVLFHLVDDAAYRAALGNIARLLAPGGWFLWSDNFIHQPTIRVEHQVSRSLSEVEGLLAEAGFEIERRIPMFVLMNYPADTRSKLPRWAWTAMVAPAVASDLLGGALGALLFPLERWLVRSRRESPSTELMVCRRRP